MKYVVLVFALTEPHLSYAPFASLVIAAEYAKIAAIMNDVTHTVLAEVLEEVS